MNKTKEFDVVIIGAGPAGYPAAIRAAKMGASVAIVEKDKPGGTCLNRGCIPTKYLVHQTSIGNTNWDSLIGGKNELIDGLVNGISFLWDKLGVTSFSGVGEVISNGNVIVRNDDDLTELSAMKGILYAPGSVSLDIPTMPVDNKLVLDSDDLLAAGGDFGSCAIVGAGAIGLEWASILNRCGTDVTVIEMMPQALPGLDSDMAKRLVAAMKKGDVKFKLKTSVEGIETAEDSVTINLPDGVKETFDRVLVAVGRRANIDEVSLQNTGIAIDKRRVTIDEYCSTTLRDVYSAGDCAGTGPMLAHLATKQGLVAMQNILGDKPERVNYNAVPYAVFADPECAGVGLTAINAKEQGYNVKEGRMDYRSLGRPTADENTFGFIKVVGDVDSGKLLGCHALGFRSSEVVQVATTVISLGGDVRDLADIIPIHPTYTELLQEAAEDWLGAAVHKL